MMLSFSLITKFQGNYYSLKPHKAPVIEKDMYEHERHTDISIFHIFLVLNYLKTVELK